MKDKNQHTNADRGATQNGTGQRKELRGLVSLGHAFLNEQKAARAEEQSHKGTDRRWTKWGAIAAISYTLITIVIMLMSITQAFISRDAEKRQLRAYFSISSIAVECCGHIDRFDKIIERSNVIKAVVKNVGLTPASDVRVRIGSVGYDFGAPFPTNLNINDPEASNPPQAFPIIEGSQYVAPGDTTQFVGPVNVPLTMWTQSRISRTIIYGHVEYSDIFDERHATNFCRIYFFGPEGKEEFETCPGYNGERQETKRWYLFGF